MPGNPECEQGIGVGLRNPDQTLEIREDSQTRRGGEQGKINVDVKGQRLVVTLEGTSYRVVFRLSPDKSQLIESLALGVDRAAPMTHEDFEAMAWEAANQKARELGWIS